MRSTVMCPTMYTISSCVLTCRRILQLLYFLLLSIQLYWAIYIFFWHVPSTQFDRSMSQSKYDPFLAVCFFRKEMLNDKWVLGTIRCLISVKIIYYILYERKWNETTLQHGICSVLIEKYLYYLWNQELLMTDVIIITISNYRHKQIILTQWMCTAAQYRITKPITDGRRY